MAQDVDLGAGGLVVEVVVVDVVDPERVELDAGVGEVEVRVIDGLEILREREPAGAIGAPNDMTRDGDAVRRRGHIGRELETVLGQYFEVALGLLGGHIGAAPAHISRRLREIGVEPGARVGKLGLERCRRHKGGRNDSCNYK